MKNRKNGRDKRKDQKRHAKDRFYLRFGFVLTDQNYDRMCRAIQNNEYEFIEKQSNTRSLFKTNITKDAEGVVVDKYPVYMIYDKKRGQIATFLTKDMYEERQ